ncbi:AAA family ATPase [Cadophora sp. MPI-SDFR-AT-0126]|nr:AAA family ATPase [Leotiomycetes sp. MPI-SDFR-AT-0126]
MDNPAKNGLREKAGSYGQLLDRIASLEAENQDLKQTRQTLARGQTVNFILADSGTPSMAYLDEPNWSIGPKGEIILTAHFPVADINGFLRQKNDIAFVIARYYTPKTQEMEVQNASRAKHPLPMPKPSSEALTFLSKEMIDAAERFFARRPDFAQNFPQFNIRGPIPAPYLFWYHYRGTDAMQGLSPVQEALFRLVTTWIEDNYGEKYGLVEKQLERGVISQETVPFLFKPGDVIVWEAKREIHAAIARSWPAQTSTEFLSQSNKERDWSKVALDTDKLSMKWKLESWRYQYDGQFLRKQQSVEVIYSATSMDEEVSISKLNVYPLRYAPEVFRSILEKRGRTFWRCRYQKVVSYDDDKGIYGSGERFVIDFETYRQLHSSSSNFKMLYPSIDAQDCEHMTPEMMASEHPPSAPDIYIFPNTIPGYDLRSKKWVDLEVDMIRDIKWNKKSFDHLVVDSETKELIQALVIRQIASEQGTDIIDRKGNGLIILLHGGPGTGKTFTAESVAEMAEKPLFRVTCGDIGTKPEDVEKYLESVLHLGKTWGCVVLIDEAEVFLEQRRLDNLERNALVSVFLRVLEYYEGILILTSNRVGTFDEAFKSRILLSLHYENLTKGQRTKIWKNFISRLKDMDDNQSTGIDFGDIECYLSELAEHELNGRQIRNVITTARQLATFRGEKTSFKHLKHVITVSGKFDTYLKTVQEGFSDDQIARGDGFR